MGATANYVHHLIDDLIDLTTIAAKGLASMDSDLQAQAVKTLEQLNAKFVELNAIVASLGIADSTLAPDKPRTGWRFVRGSHGFNYVRDPQGVDRLPPGYGVTSQGANLR